MLVIIYEIFIKWKFKMLNKEKLKVGLVSVSDRASQGVYQDEGIPALQSWLEKALTEAFDVEVRLIPDEQPLIEQTLIDLVDNHHCHLVLTTGGTGPAKRDVTPDARLWRTNAPSEFAIRANCDSFPPSGRHSSRLAHSKPTRPTKSN